MLRINHGHLLTGSDCSEVVLIYFDLFLWLEHEICIEDSTAFCREQYNGVWSYSYVIPQIFTSWDFAQQEADGQMLFLTDWPCTWFRRWVYQVWADCLAFDFSHVVDIPICGNRLWYALTLPMRSNCWGCKGILGLTEQTWIFHTNHSRQMLWGKRDSRIWTSCRT